jgi:hypothetical protein
MTKEQALKKTKSKFTNLIDGKIIPGYSVGEIISHYESLIKTGKATTRTRDSIMARFLDEEINEEIDDSYEY